MTAMPPTAPVLRVLAVDDNPAEFALLADGFSGCGILVDLSTATSASLALAGLMLGDVADRPHVALIDINMPMVSGFELATQMIRDGIPTIMMSTQITDAHAVRARDLGVLDLLAKPSDGLGYAALVARVLRALRAVGVP